MLTCPASQGVVSGVEDVPFAEGAVVGSLRGCARVDGRSPGSCETGPGRQTWASETPCGLVMFCALSSVLGGPQLNECPLDPSVQTPEHQPCLHPLLHPPKLSSRRALLPPCSVQCVLPHPPRGHRGPSLLICLPDSRLGLPPSPSPHGQRDEAANLTVEKTLPQLLGARRVKN